MHTGRGQGDLEGMMSPPSPSRGTVWLWKCQGENEAGRGRWGSGGGGGGSKENSETQNLTCTWKPLERSLVSSQNDDTVQVVGKMGNLVSTCFDYIG